jgi:arylsulfatase A-like enzyme
MDARPRPLGFWQFSGESEDEDDLADKSITTNSGPSAWSDNRYKLVKTPPKKTTPSKWELFDLTTDRSEKNDIGAEHPEIVQRMKAELESWQLSVIQSYRGEDYPEKKVIQPTKTPSKQP